MANDSKIVGLDNKPLDEGSREDAARKLKLDPRLMCVGRFAIPRATVQRDLTGMMELLSDMVVVRCELIYEIDVFEYTAISDKYFMPVDEGDISPIYAIARRPDGKFIATRT